MQKSGPYLKKSLRYWDLKFWDYEILSYLGLQKLPQLDQSLRYRGHLLDLVVFLLALTLDLRGILKIFIFLVSPFEEVWVKNQNSNFTNILISDIYEKSKLYLYLFKSVRQHLKRVAKLAPLL